jgi:pyruvate/2-oxoglutarate dehydrogenase complex dihydrolipoamide acyltransferase (E2) component
VNQPIVEIETAKAAVELPCPYAGTVQTRHAKEGDTVPVGAPLPTRIVVLPGVEGGVGALGVAASLLRHIPAESVLLAIHEASTPERERASRLRILLDSRSRAQTEHGLDMRTELRFGDPDAELARELSVDPQSMLVIGVDSLDDTESARLKSLLEGALVRPVLIVRAPDGTG